jgi:hypothetical protein
MRALRGGSQYALAVAVLAVSSAARGQLLDRDGLLVDAAAVPKVGTVRLSGSGGGQTAASSTDTATGTVSGSVLWVPVTGLGGDVGAYYQTGRSGPSARLRYQLLEQERAGVSLSLGARYKSEGFAGEGSGEVEALVALGRSFGRLDLVLNLVWGWEINDPGQDVEVKVLVGWRFSDDLRLGLEVRAQSEVHDEEGWHAPSMRATDFSAGPTLLWRLARPVVFQVLVGVGKPVQQTSAGFLALGAFNVDF